MLCVNSYSEDYIDACRSKVASQLAAYKTLVDAGTPTTNAAFASAVEAFEPLFFSNLVVVLDSLFVHRSRALELKDGNPLNEVRMLCNSILQSGGVMTADKTIKFKPAASVLKIQIGDSIHIGQADFVRLSEAFFAEMEAKFGKRGGAS